MTKLTKEQTIIAQLEAIRRSGKTNMYAKNRVQQIANQNNFYGLVIAIENDYEQIMQRYELVIQTLKEEDIPCLK